MKTVSPAHHRRGKGGRLPAYLALLGNTIIWSLAFPFVKKGFDQGLTPINFLLGRYFFATLTSLPLLFLLRPQVIKTTFRLPNLLKIVFLELIGTVATLWLLYQGLNLTSSIESTLIAITTPIFVTLGGVFFLSEREEKHEWFGLLLAVFGSALLIIQPLIKHNPANHSLGNLLILTQNLTVAIYYLAAKRHYHHLNKWLISHLSFWVGLISFSLLALYQGHSPITQVLSLFNFSAGFWPLLAVLYMAIPGSLIALTLYLIGQDKIEASEAAVFTYLQPLFALPVAVILLNESISPTEIIALILILAGVIINEKRR